MKGGKENEYESVFSKRKFNDRSPIPSGKSYTHRARLNERSRFPIPPTPNVMIKEGMINLRVGEEGRKGEGSVEMMQIQ